MGGIKPYRPAPRLSPNAPPPWQQAKPYNAKSQPFYDLVNLLKFKGDAQLVEGVKVTVTLCTLFGFVENRHAFFRHRFLHIAEAGGRFCGRSFFKEAE
jgi:hypothetical protein